MKVQSYVPPIEFGGTPESVGISSANIAKVLDAYREADLAMHSVLVLRHGKLVAEGYAEPFNKDSFHRMYSISKSFVGIAIGILEGEGKISINDTIDKYFPDKIDENTDPLIRKTKIVDLLRMASPFPTGATYNGRTDDDWLSTFFVAPTSKEPGSEFLYDTSASYVLDVIVERVTGMKFLDYMKEKALMRMGFSTAAWCVGAPEGYSWGGSGILCTSRDLMRFAYLVMNGGRYKDEQLVPADYVKAATSNLIDTTVSETNELMRYGYGYQIWQLPNGFAFHGMGNQQAFCIPDKDLIFVCTADNQGNGNARGIVYGNFVKYVLETLSDEPLNEDKEGEKMLAEAYERMQIPYVKGEATSSMAEKINGVTFTADYDNISEFKIDLRDGEGTFTYVTPRGTKNFDFGILKNVTGTIDEPQYSGIRIKHPIGRGYRTMFSGAWETDTRFALKVQVIDDYFGNMKLTFDFEGDTATLNVTKTAEWFFDEYVTTDVKFTKK